MATAEQIRAEVQALTSELIGGGICIDQNFPSLKTQPGGVQTVGFAGLDDLAITLKNVHYVDAYATLSERRAFNMRLIDGAMVQLLYTFVDGALTRHRLAFFPSPDLLEYQNNAEVYEEDERYAEVVARNVVTVPVRFDFDRSGFVAVVHPMSHVTLGQYKNCRIPVYAPLTPHSFLDFLLSSFYNSPYRNVSASLRASAPHFDPTIAPEEREGLHLSAG